MRLREHYDQRLAQIRARLGELGKQVTDGLSLAVDALMRQDLELAQRVIADDMKIDRAQMALSQEVVLVIATQQPTAGDLRRLLATIEIASELERIGDYAKSIAKVAVRIGQEQHIAPLPDIEHMARRAMELLQQMVGAFIQEDDAAALRLSQADDTIDSLYKRVRADLTAIMQRDPESISQALELIVVAQRIERIADRATNIAERVIYMVKGSVVVLND